MSTPRDFGFQLETRLTAVRELWTRMFENVASWTRPSPTPTRIALHGEESWQFETVTNAQSCCRFRRLQSPRSVMQSSAVSMRQSLTVTCWEQSMSSPSPLCVWKPVRTLWMSRPRAKTRRHPWRKQLQ